MGVRNSGGDNGLYRTASVPSSTAFTIVGQAIVDTIPGAAAFSFVSGIQISTLFTGYALLGWHDGSWSVATNASKTGFATVPTAGQPFSWALKCSGTGATDCVGYWWPLNGTPESAAAQGTSFSNDRLVIGNDTINQPLLGHIAHVKVWDAALTDAELLTEMASWQPKRFTNLNLYSPLWTQSDVKDYSGNGRDWTTLGTLTDGTTPPSPWGADGSYTLYTSSIIGTVALTRGVGTVAVDGDPVVTGTVAATRGAGTVAVDGTSTVTGTVALTRGAGAVAVDGTSTVTGTVAATRGVGAVAIDGDPIVDADVALTRGVGAVAIDVDPVVDGTVAASRGVGTVAIDVDPAVTGTVALTRGAGAVAVDITSTVTGTVALSRAAGVVSILEEEDTTLESDDFFLHK